MHINIMTFFNRNIPFSPRISEMEDSFFGCFFCSLYPAEYPGTHEYQKQQKWKLTSFDLNKPVSGTAH